MKSDNTQHNDDFLHALHEDIPQDFEDNLYQRLLALDDNETDSTDTPRTPSRFGWTLAVASLMAVLLGGILLFSSQSSPQMLSTPNLPLDHVTNQRISADNAALLRPFDTLAGETAYNISLSPDGAQLAVMTDDALYLHDAHDLQADPRRIELSTTLHDTHFLADGRLIGLQADETETPYIVSLDTQTGTLTSLIELPPGHVDYSELIINDAGTQAVFAGCDQTGGQITRVGGKLLCEAGNYTIAAFDLATGDRLFTKDITEETVADIALVGNDEWLIYFPTLRDGARAHNLQSGDEVALHLPENGMRSESGRPGYLYQVFASSDGEHIAFSGLSRRGDVRVWHVETLLNHSLNRAADDTPPEHLFGFYKYPSGDITFHPVTGEMLSAGYEMYVISPDDDVDWLTQPVTLDAPIDTVSQTIFDSSGERFYLLTRMGLLQVWDWQTQQPTHTVTDYISADYRASAVSSADGQRTVVFEKGEFNGMAPMLYDASGEQVTERFLQATPDAYHPAVAVTISADGRFVAVLEVRDILFDTDPTLVLHDLQTGEVRDIQKLPSMQLISTVQMAFDSENNLRILMYPGKIWHYTLDMLLGESEPPERPMNLVYLNELMNWQALMRGTIATGVATGFAINQDYLAAYTCMKRANTNCTENVLFVWDIRNQTVADNGVTENRHLMRIDLPDTDLRPHAYGVPTISPDGRIIAVERCLTEDVSEGSYGESYYCTQSELLVWQMDDVQNGDMEPVTRVPLHTTRSTLAFSPQADDNGNRLLAVGGFDREEGEHPLQAEASTSLYQVTADADISHVQTMDGEYQPVFREDGNVLYLYNLEMRDYRAWGVPGLANR